MAWALGLTLLFLIIEGLAGWLGKSLALLSDAGHNLTDAGALAMSLVVLRLAAQPARGNRTFGLRRSEIDRLEWLSRHRQALAGARTRPWSTISSLTKFNETMSLRRSGSTTTRSATSL